VTKSQSCAAHVAFLHLVCLAIGQVGGKRGLGALYCLLYHVRGPFKASGMGGEPESRPTGDDAPTERGAPTELSVIEKKASAGRRVIVPSGRFARGAGGRPPGGEAYRTCALTPKRKLDWPRTRRSPFGGDDQFGVAGPVPEESFRRVLEKQATQRGFEQLPAIAEQPGGRV
jgi:hypothetical protein